MERAGATPHGGIRPDDLVSLLERTTPVATVWMRRSGTGEYGRTGDDASRRRVEAELRDAGASDEVVAAVDAALVDVDPGARGVVVIADAERAALVEPLPDEPRTDRVAWGQVPALTPVIEHRQAQVPTIVVLADRAGAELIVTQPDGDDVTVEVEGEDRPITKVGVGGWSHRRYHQRAEDSWEQNARQVAARIVELAAAHPPELVIVGGDERAVDLIRAALPERLQPLTRTMTPGRSHDGSADQRDDEVRRLVNTAVAAETVQLVRRFREEDGRGARSAVGDADVFAALRSSQVDVLLVHDDPDDDRLAWFGDELADVGMDPAELVSAAPSQGRRVDVAVRAALGTGASVRVVPAVDALDDGMAAILRWSA